MTKLIAALLLLTMASPATAQNSASTGPTVVELFTSQGCNSCPPADAFLGELAERNGVLALSIHVDYWDYLGWRDPFANKAFSDRQRQYSGTLAQRYVYTPQMVIDGHLQEVGSDRAAVERLLQKAQHGGRGGPSLAMASDPRGPAVAIGPGSGHGTVWLVTFDRQQTTAIGRGENSGRTITYHNVVRDWRRLGDWRGEAMTLPLSLPQAALGERCAVLVQKDEVGPILAALAFDRPR